MIARAQQSSHTGIHSATPAGAPLCITRNGSELSVSADGMRHLRLFNLSQKIARQRYFMKADDEDIFVLSSDIPEKTNEQDENETIGTSNSMVGA